jgi:hypothetical protein
MSEIRELVMPALKQIEADVSDLKSDLDDITRILDAQTGQLDRILTRLQIATGLSPRHVAHLKRWSRLRDSR